MKKSKFLAAAIMTFTTLTGFASAQNKMKELFPKVEVTSTALQFKRGQTIYGTGGKITTEEPVLNEIKTRTTLFYKANGTLSGKNVESYDKNGNRTSYEDYSDEGDLVNSSEYKYDKKGKIISSTSMSKRNIASSTSVSTKKEFECDDKGNIILEKINQDGTTKTYTYHYEYDNNGNKVLFEISNDRQDLDHGNKFVYEYLEEENIILEKHYFKDELQEEDEYKYDEKENKFIRTQHEYLKFHWGTEINHKRYEYVFDDKGNKILEKEYFIDHEDSGKTTRYEYDEKGNLIAESSSSGKFSEKKEYKYEYDSKGNMTLKNIYKNGVITNTTKYKYNYY